MTITPVRAAAFGPTGEAGGDNPQLAPLAIDASATTRWHTDWYATAGFGNLQAGTGLLLDLGHPVTVTRAQITLGSSTGTELQLRAGNAVSTQAVRGAGVRIAPAWALGPGCLGRKTRFSGRFVPGRQRPGTGR